MNDANIVIEGEIWKGVVGFEDSYEVSNKGRVKSLRRQVVGRYGSPKWLPESLLTITKFKNKASYVTIRLNNKSVKANLKKLIQATFAGERYIAPPAGKSIDFGFVDELIKGGDSVKDICQKIGVDKSTLSKWIKRDRGATCFKKYVAQVIGKYQAPVSVIRNLSFEEFNKVVLIHKDSNSVAIFLGVTRNTIYKLSRRFGYKSFAEATLKINGEPIKKHSSTNHKEPKEKAVKEKVVKEKTIKVLRNKQVKAPEQLKAISPKPIKTPKERPIKIQKVKVEKVKKVVVEKYSLLPIETLSPEIFTLISQDYTPSQACEMCKASYHKFKIWFRANHDVSIRVHSLILRGKTVYGRKNHKEYRKVWMKGNVVQKLSKRISTSILKCLGKAKIQKTSWILKEELGYTIDDLKAHLEAQFDSNMTWDNHGSYWHIDHRTPVTWFTFHSSSCEGFRQCWALSNLQPKEAIENMRKNNRYAD